MVVMKKMISLSIIIFGISTQAAFFNQNLNCQDRVKFAARALWSVNSAVDMKYLVGEILGSKKTGQFVEYSVEVNTPRFPNLVQNVPYLVRTQINTKTNNCIVSSVTATPVGYGR